MRGLIYFIISFFHYFIPWGTAWGEVGVGASELWGAVCLGSAKLRALARLGFNGCKSLNPKPRWPAASQVASRERPTASEGGGGLGFTPLAFGWMHCGYDFLLARRPLRKSNSFFISSCFSIFQFCYKFNSFLSFFHVFIFFIFYIHFHSHFLKHFLILSILCI